MFKTFLAISPVAKARPRVTRKGTFTPRRTELAQMEIRHWLHANKAPKFEGALSMGLVFHFLKPKSAPKKRVWPTVKPDADNLTKMVCDSCNGILYKDDSQIVRLFIEKRYSETEGIEITLEAI
jgi:Holliday junction resolvase RusA-like endonuclease